MDGPGVAKHSHGQSGFLESSHLLDLYTTVIARKVHSLHVLGGNLQLQRGLEHLCIQEEND